MKVVPSLRALALAAAGALALGACGGDPQPIPRDQAAALIADLEEAKRRVDAGACDDLQRGTFVRLDRRIERLPADVDGGVEQALRDGVSHLKGIAEDECAQNRPAVTSTSTSTSTSTTMEPLPTTTTQPEQPTGDEGSRDESTTTTPTEPPPKSPEPPSDTPGKGKGSGGTPPGQSEEEG